MKDTDFNELAKRAHENAKAKGFYNEMHTDAHYLMLVVCELAEAVEADRCGKRADRKEYERLAGVCEERVQPHLFEFYIKDTVEDELADAVIYLLSYVGLRGFVIPQGYITKENLNGILDKTFRTVLWDSFRTFAERMLVSCVNNVLKVGDRLPDSAIYSVFAFAELYGIDLMWHVMEKMRYNETRGMLHGKAY